MSTERACGLPAMPSHVFVLLSFVNVSKLCPTRENVLWGEMLVYIYIYIAARSLAHHPRLQTSEMISRGLDVFRAIWFYVDLFKQCT